MISVAQEIRDMDALLTADDIAAAMDEPMKWKMRVRMLNAHTLPTMDGDPTPHTTKQISGRPPRWQPNVTMENLISRPKF